MSAKTLRTCYNMQINVKSVLAVQAGKRFTTRACHLQSLEVRARAVSAGTTPGPSPPPRAQAISLFPDLAHNQSACSQWQGRQPILYKVQHASLTPRLHHHQMQAFQKCLRLVPHRVVPNLLPPPPNPPAHTHTQKRFRSRLPVNACWTNQLTHCYWEAGEGAGEQRLECFSHLQTGQPQLHLLGWNEGRKSSSRAGTLWGLNQLTPAT